MVGKLTEHKAHGGDSHAKNDPHGDSHAKNDPHGDSHAENDPHGDSHAENDPHGDSHAENDPHGDSHAEGKSHEDTNSSALGQWSYEGETGPTHWDQFSKIAKTGIRQSPIDLITQKTVTPVNLTPVGFHYQDSVFSLNNNGHTIQAECDPDNSIVIDGYHYTLLQFHFHASSEHLIDGKSYPMEVHLVHVISDKQNELPPDVQASKPPAKSLAVIGVMIKEGKANSLIGNLWKKIPDPKEPPVHYFITGQNANALLPEPGKRSFYRYNGSLTTPPCTENVLWTVMSEPIEFSKEQIESFTKLYSKNNRPPQKTHQRFVLNYHDSGDLHTPSAPVSAPQPPIHLNSPAALPSIPALPKGGASKQPPNIRLQPVPLQPAKIIAPIAPEEPLKPRLTINE
jgi:carbonic anhydrase